MLTLLWWWYKTDALGCISHTPITSASYQLLYFCGLNLLIRSCSTKSWRCIFIDIDVFFVLQQVFFSDAGKDQINCCLLALSRTSGVLLMQVHWVGLAWALRNQATYIQQILSILYWQGIPPAVSEKGRNLCGLSFIKAIDFQSHNPAYQQKSCHFLFSLTSQSDFWQNKPGEASTAFVLVNGCSSHLLRCSIPLLLLFGYRHPKVLSRAWGTPIHV